MNRLTPAVVSFFALMICHSASAEPVCKMDADQCERLANMNRHMQEIMDDIREGDDSEANDGLVDIQTSEPVKPDNKQSEKAKLSKGGLALRDYKKGMERMHKAMNITYTGSTDTDFTRGMIPHHQGAVDMAQTELKYGKDESMRSLAKQIITAQKQEIAFMKTWLTRRADRHSKRSKAEIAALPQVKAFEEANHDMHQGMMVKYTGNPDIDFARMMIPHHQGAIEMAKVFLEHGGQDPSLHKIARDILLSQNREINEMLNWLEDNTDRLVKGKKGKKKTAKIKATAPVKQDSAPHHH